MSRIFPLLSVVFRANDPRTFPSEPRGRRVWAGRLVCAAAVLAALSAERLAAEESVDTGSADYRRSVEKERYFRKAETEFTNWDTNANLVIDEEEWPGILEEHRAKLMAANPSPERFSAMDANKDGTLSELEIDAWIKLAFRKRVKPYTDSEIYKQRKAEYEKTH